VRGVCVRVLLRDCDLVVDVVRGVFWEGVDVLVEDGVVVDVGSGLGISADVVLSCSGCVVVPALVNSFFVIGSPPRGVSPEDWVRSRLRSLCREGVSRVFCVSEFIEVTYLVSRDLGLECTVLVPVPVHDPVSLWSRIRGLIEFRRRGIDVGLYLSCVPVRLDVVDLLCFVREKWGFPIAISFYNEVRDVRDSVIDVARPVIPGSLLIGCSLLTSGEYSVVARLGGVVVKVPELCGRVCGSVGSYVSLIRGCRVCLGSGSVGSLSSCIYGVYVANVCEFGVSDPRYVLRCAVGEGLGFGVLDVDCRCDLAVFELVHPRHVVTDTWGTVLTSIASKSTRYVVTSRRVIYSRGSRF